VKQQKQSRNDEKQHALFLLYQMYKIIINRIDSAVTSWLQDLSEVQLLPCWPIQEWMITIQFNNFGEPPTFSSSAVTIGYSFAFFKYSIAKSFLPSRWYVFPIISRFML
jgi:hypothetical protein